MSPSNRPGGRDKRIVTGGGNANRRGSGLGTGPVGGGSRPSFGGNGASNRGDGERSTSGGGLIALLAALLIGKAASSSSGSGSSKGGCFKRILLLVGIVLVVSVLLKMCSGNSLFSELDNSYSGDTGLSGTLIEETAVPEATAAPTDSLTTLFNSLNGASSTVSTATESAYQAHQPDTSVAAASRERYTQILGDGQDTVTVMVYLCGTDLESQNGMATADINEMLSAKFGDNVRIIVETGGCSYWQNNVISAKTNQIYEVRQGGIKVLEKNLGKKSMVAPTTLASFIQYCKQNYEANRYMLILWDHGGGSISGYGYDELYPDGSMTLDQIGQALQNGGCKFDLIGFDACLMGSLETALVLEPYADYMIGSEATEPGTGWYYTNWITQLSADSSMPTLEVGKAIIDDFVKVSQQSAPSSSATLSLIDLAELSGTVPSAFNSFSRATSSLISADGYEQVANARSGAKDFSSGSKINQIDLIHFAENLGTDESISFANVLRSCVKYNRVDKNISHANGISIYFPYNSLSKVSAAVDTYEKIGLDESYTSCIKSFASMAAGGSLVSGGSSNPLGSLLGDDSGSLLGSLLEQSASSSTSSSASSYGTMDTVSALLDLFLSSSSSGRSVVTGDDNNDWIDADLLSGKSSYFTENAVGLQNLQLSKKYGSTVLSLTEEQWSKVKTLEQNVFLDDGSGYIDLGLDTVMDWNDDGDLIMDYDGTWISLNGQIVSYYFVSQDFVDDGYTILGRIPAILTHHKTSGETENLPVDGKDNDYMHAKKDSGSKMVSERVNIILAFTNEHPYGIVLGAQTDYHETTDVLKKGLTEIKPGDLIDFLCDYYRYDGSYDDSYYLGEQMTVPSTDWVIGNAPVGNDSYRMTYRLTDVYGAQYWTPTVTGD